MTTKKPATKVQICQPTQGKLWTGNNGSWSFAQTSDDMEVPIEVNGLGYL